jgi:hypothetical protein
MLESLHSWFGVLQVVVVLLLTADRWVHKVTGKASLETRVAQLEKGMREVRKTVHDGVERLHKKNGELQKQLIDLQVWQGRQEEHFESTDDRVKRMESYFDQMGRS